ncbi:bifunctional metallophosphatase/5'-nucleotidase [Isobaculum melis]|uniref:5'-nucleotidase n=1 Tax=Isobaculum melis TaxID=142588 RepID=A0A1H9SF93_9LACT|nr:bifunctional metallophosphatase/5'-nucleotidase [Isobaculum melis]SER83644.1 5'-nucleotidase [Isobaculum melis]
MKKSKNLLSKLFVFSLIFTSFSPAVFAEEKSLNPTIEESPAVSTEPIVESSLQPEPTITTTSPETEPSQPQLQTQSIKEITPKVKTTIPLQLLGINDFHGALSTTGTAYIEGTPYRGAGRAALLASYLNLAETNFKALKPTGTTLRVQAGDMVGASPANSGLLQDEPTIRALNRMNFTIGTLGNHEFDEGLAEYNRILTGTAPKPGEFNTITENYIREASKTEIVIANMTDKNTGTIPFGWKPYTVKSIEANGESVKVGFIGIVTTEIPNLVLKKHYENYNFLNEAETIARYSKELRDQGVNAIVVLAHVPAVSSNQVVSGEAADIINQVNAMDPENSVDAFFAGHNHQYTNGVTGQTRIVQSTSQGKAYIDLTGELDPETQDFVAIPEAEVLPVMPNPALTEDTGIQSIISEADALVAMVTTEKIGTAVDAQNISREPNAFKESAVGNLVTDGQRFIANQLGYQVDFAMTNNGGIRADLLVEPDNAITWGAAQNVQPFGNILQVVEMSGEQIERVLNEQYDEGGKYFLQVSGLSYVYTDNDDAEQPAKVHQIRKEDGTRLDPNATYRVVINDFLFGGGDGFKTFTEAKLVGAVDPDTETFINYIKAQEAAGQVIDAKVTGRKTYLSATDIQAAETAAVQAIKDATKIHTLTEGDSALTGTTLPNAMISVQLKESLARSSLTTTATENGEFSLDITNLALTKDQIVAITITDTDGNQAQFEQTVLEKAQITETEKPNPNKPDNIGSSIDQPKGSSTSKDPTKLPATGEVTTFLPIAGVLMIGAAGIYVMKKRKCTA